MEGQDLPDWGAADEDLGRRAPSEARLQLARRPLIIGVGSSHAFLAASASLNVTCFQFNKTHTRRMLVPLT